VHTLPDIPSIAVLPFANLSGDAQKDYFSDGITDDLVTDLSRLPGLFVIDCNSTFASKGKTSTVREVGRELGVKYVLKGSARRERRIVCGSMFNWWTRVPVIKSGRNAMISGC
jgi:TolB-like protein